MTTAKIFENGRSQAVRLPKEYRFDDDEVYVSKMDDIVMLIPKNHRWASMIESLDMFTDDFMKDGRGKEIQQERESL